ncbi:hypothetical protein P7K49_023867 [Saguinus oedipus]|uniref:Uncharacterized protein n=1 Tax=Saguinus oedipus TaxID=9490 RepID=A0ABQ9UMW7_SAGOE|nr:hypothetical protein P7K49_023867 [Saguinus oedipus]
MQDCMPLATTGGERDYPLPPGLVKSLSSGCWLDQGPQRRAGRADRSAQRMAASDFQLKDGVMVGNCKEPPIGIVSSWKGKIQYVRLSLSYLKHSPWMPNGCTKSLCKIGLHNSMAKTEGSSGNQSTNTRLNLSENHLYT